MKGRIQDFGLADVLQLIVSSGKSGLLTLDNGADEVQIGLQDGWIVSADTPFRPSGAQLAPRMVRAGVLTQAQMGAVLKRRAETGEPVATILAALRYAAPDTIRHYSSLQVTDMLLDLFTWKAGDYDFDEHAPRHDEPLEEPINIEHLLMHGFRIMDEWPLVCARIPNFAYRILERRPLPPMAELTVEDLFSELAAPPTEIQENERLIHELCLPGTTVQTIIDRAPIDRFETSRCISTLIGADLVNLEPPA